MYAFATRLGATETIIHKIYIYTHSACNTTRYSDERVRHVNSLGDRSNTNHPYTIRYSSLYHNYMPDFVAVSLINVHTNCWNI